MNSVFKKLFGIVMTLMVIFTVFVQPAAAQKIDKDLKDVFERMMDDLDDDLREKFQEAIEKDRASVEFNPDEFRRFQQNPVNPFDGIQEIDADTLTGNIELKFQLPSIRNRPISPYEKQHRNMLRSLSPVTRSFSRSVVSIQDGYGNQPQVALGTVVDSNGLLITKASEVEDLDRIVCKWSSGREMLASIRRIDRANDVALLEVVATDLVAIQWSESQPKPGSFLVSPGAAGQAITLGTYSSVPRSTRFERAFLGVQPYEVKDGIQVAEITERSAAGAAGLLDGDVITKFDSQQIRNVSDLVNYIRMRSPGDKIEIEYVRSGTVSRTTATLSSQSVSSRQAAQFKMMNRLGAVPSRRDRNFPMVFQHDSPLFPEQCGGPILDLEGRVVGLNIAREGRASTYSIPSNHLKTVLEDLMREGVASKQ